MYFELFFTILLAMLAYSEVMDVNEDTPSQNFSRLVTLTGKEAKNGQFPFYVSLYLYPESELESNWVCGGTLISEQYVLTLGDCITSKSKGKYASSTDVYVGTPTKVINYSELKKIHIPKDNFIVHPDYKDQDENNIALIKLPEPVESSEFIQPAKLPSRTQAKEDLVGKSVISLAWVYPADTNEIILNYLETKVIPGIECTKDSDFCIESNIITCKSEGGESNILQENGVNTVVGITVRSDDCYLNKPGLLIRVANYLDWISEVTGIPV